MIGGRDSARRELEAYLLLEGLLTMLQGLDFRGRLLIVQSNGGVMAPGIAKETPVAMLESKTVGGYIAAARMGTRPDGPNVIASDMGGTTAKANRDPHRGPSTFLTRDFERAPGLQSRPMVSSNARRTVLILAGLIAAGLSGLTAARYRRDSSRAIERVSTGSQIAETRCGPIEYAVAGEGAPVLVVHGAGGGYDQGLEFAEPLTRSGFRVIAMSRFGYLRTPLPSDASPAVQADAYACLLDALNVTQVALAGVSAGGPSSMQFALRHPERITALVLVVPAAYVPRSDEETPTDTARGPVLVFDTALKSDFLFWALIKLAPGTATRTILGTPETVVENAGAAEQARVQQTLDHVLPVSLRRQGLLNDAAVVSSLGRFELEKIATPTLVIGAADCLYGTFDGARYTAAHIPGARFVGYPSGGHLLVGHQEAVTSEIVAFLR